MKYPIYIDLMSNGNRQNYFEYGMSGKDSAMSQSFRAPLLDSDISPPIDRFYFRAYVKAVRTYSIYDSVRAA